MANCEKCQEGTDCRPCNCSDCGQAAPPVLPKCDGVNIPDGTFTNATVTVEGGCITSISSGAFPLYSPECCAGGVMVAPPNPSPIAGLASPGRPGESATVSVVGTIMVPHDQPAEVVNQNPDSPHAELLFKIPQCDCDIPPPTTTGVTDTSTSIRIEDGLVKGIPVATGLWPPVLMIAASPASGSPNYSLTIDNSLKDSSGVVSIGLEMTPLETKLAQAEFDILLLKQKIQDLTDAVNCLVTATGSACTPVA